MMQQKMSTWFLLCALVLPSSTVRGDIRLGPQRADYGNKIEVLEPGPDLHAVMTNITDASATNPYVVYLGPGIYDVGAASLVVKPFVTLRGSSKLGTVVTAESGEVDGAIVVMKDNTLLQDLTVRHQGGSGAAAVGVIGEGVDFRVESTRIEVTKNFATVAKGFEGGNVSGSFEFSGVLSHVEIHVVDGNGIGGAGTSGDLKSLRIENSYISIVNNQNTSVRGIADANFVFSGDRLVVTDTTIEISGEAIGVRIGSDIQLYRNLNLRITGDDSWGFTRAGSGMRPVIEDSRIELIGTSNKAFQSNFGIIKVRGSTIIATVGLTASSNGGTYTFDNCVFDVTTGFDFLSTTGGSTKLRVGNSKLDATTNISIASGGVDEVCINTYDENYAAVNADCTP